MYWIGGSKKQFKYPVLSRLARDLLTIPVSTVASESAFSIGGMVLDQCRSSLLPETVEALLCVRDWSFGKKCEDSSIMDILAEDVLNLNISQKRQLCISSTFSGIFQESIDNQNVSSWNLMREFNLLAANPTNVSTS